MPPSPRTLGSGDATWDADYEFDDEGWDEPIRGRAVLVEAGETKALVASMRHGKKDKSDERVIRLSVSAGDHPLVFKAITTLDNEELTYTINVSRNGTRSISFSCDRFVLWVTHPGAGGINANLVPDSLAQFRIDDKANAPSAWVVSEVITGTGAEVTLAPPPFTESFELLTNNGNAGSINFYNGVVGGGGTLLATIPVTGPQQGRITANDLGDMTLTANAGLVFVVQYRCIG